jgi:hypothetical protein
MPPPAEEAPVPKPALSFGQSETVEFETDTEEEERPRLQMGEDMKLDLSDDEEEPAAKPTGVMELNL